MYEKVHQCKNLGFQLVWVKKQKAFRFLIPEATICQNTVDHSHLMLRVCLINSYGNEIEFTKHEFV